MKGATLHRLIDIYADSRRNLRVRLAALRMFVRAVCADRNTSFAEYRQVCRRLLKGMPFTEQALNASERHIGSAPELRDRPWRRAVPGLLETQP
ncbi:hypothetical protein [Pseudomonas aeruginosa]|uniref:hypothetical protein n=1 Tax=Pseudomonas aeruginosa TaxID=287 RepID=UPI00215B3CE2|nr:hypothetical protein [Pseudomonas aeruginosa]